MSAQKGDGVAEPGSYQSLQLEEYQSLPQAESASSSARGKGPNRPSTMSRQSSTIEKVRTTTEKAWLSKFQELAEKDELDFYTCLSCSCGLLGCMHPRVRFYMYYRVPVLIATQLMVPLCLLSYQARHFEWGSGDSDLEFRLVGCTMYLYSVWNMYNNSSDECRTLFLKIAREHQLPMRFTGIALLGDVINTFCGFSLVVTLFTVFCFSTDPYNLVINCIAINFVGNVDNEFADSDLKAEAFDDLIIILKEYAYWPEDNSQSDIITNSMENEIAKGEAIDQADVNADLANFTHTSTEKNRGHWCCLLFLDSVLVILQFTRTLGTLGLGHFFGFVFTFFKSSVMEYLAELLGVPNPETWGP